MICRLALVSTAVASAYNMGPAAATQQALPMSGATQQLRPHSAMPGRLMALLTQQTQPSRRPRPAISSARHLAFGAAHLTPSAAHTQGRCGSVSMAVAKSSKAMPFLTAPACQGTGLVGDAGFDPLYLSDFMDVKWMREAELKHGRICML